MQKQDKSLNIKSINILLIENYDEKDKSISYIWVTKNISCEERGISNSLQKSMRLLQELNIFQSFELDLM